MIEIGIETKRRKVLHLYCLTSVLQCVFCFQLFHKMIPASSMASFSMPSTEHGAELLKEKIETDLNDVDLKNNYAFEDNAKGKTHYWKHFKLIKYKGRMVPFVKCNRCESILSYNVKTGTGSLVRHKCSNVLTKVQEKSSKAIKSLVSLAKRNTIVEKQVQLLAQDLHPPSVIEGRGFRAFAQELLQLGAKYGQCNFDSIVTAKTMIKSVLPEVHDEVKNNLKNVIKLNHIAFSPDLWKDEVTNRSFLTLSAHVIDDSFTLKKYVLGTRELVKINTLEDISESTIRILSKYTDAPEDKLKESVIVTDSQSDLVWAFSSNKQLICACHTLNLVMKDIFEGPEANTPDGTSDEKPSALKMLIAAIQSLIVFLRDSEIDQRLSQSFNHKPTESWDATYSMFKYVYNVFGELHEILSEARELQRVCGIDFQELGALVSFLKLFQDCSEDLCNDTIPTLHKYVLCDEKLKKHCVIEDDDMDLIKELKVTASESLKRRFIPNDIHYIALFLDPNFKSLKFLSESKRQYIVNEVTNFLKEKSDELAQMGRASTSRESDSLYAEFLDVKNESGNVEMTDNREQEVVERYQKSRLRGDEELLHFWKENYEFPLLRKLVQNILNIPASSSIKEKVFSSDAQLVAKRRGGLVSNQLDTLIFLHQNLFNV